jgi:hypothetical protein
MPRLVVTAERAERGNAPLLLDEQVHAVHLSTEHSARQFIERRGGDHRCRVGGDHARWRWNPGKHERIKPVASYLVVPRG